MPLTFFDGAVSAGGGNGVPAGLFLPVADLPGVTAGEFGSGESQATKEGKGVLALYNRLVDYFNANTADVLGWSATRATATPADSLSNFTFTVQHQYVSKLSDGSVSVIPAPDSGANSGVGALAIADIFANAASLDAEDAVSGEGMIIPYADLADYGGSAPAAISNGNDNRDVLAAITRAMPTLLSNRDASTASAFTASSQSASAPFTLPAAATAATDPTTGISASELDKIMTNQLTSSVTVQVALNQTAQTFDVNVVTA